MARVIWRLGGNATPLYAVGVPLGHACQELLETEGIRGCPIAIAGTTRPGVTVDEGSTGNQYRFVVQGPELNEIEWQRCLDILAEHMEADSYFVASGSLPLGVPDDFYGRVARLAKEHGARCVIDTSGVPLRAALDEGVFLVKPNRREMQELVEATLDTSEKQERAARSLVERDGSEIVPLTLGADGPVFSSSEGAVRIAAPKVEARSAVGAGDSFVGALILRLAQERPLEEAFRYASAAGAAALLTPATELCRLDDVERLDRQMATQRER